MAIITMESMKQRLEEIKLNEAKAKALAKLDKDNEMAKLIILKTKKMSDPDVMFNKTEETMAMNVTPGKNDSEYTECHVPSLGGINDGSGMGGNANNGGFFQ